MTPSRDSGAPYNGQTKGRNSAGAPRMTGTRLGTGSEQRAKSQTNQARDNRMEPGNTYYSSTERRREEQGAKSSSAIGAFSDGSGALRGAPWSDPRRWGAVRGGLGGSKLEGQTVGVSTDADIVRRGNRPNEMGCS